MVLLVGVLVVVVLLVVVLLVVVLLVVVLLVVVYLLVVVLEATSLLVVVWVSIDWPVLETRQSASKTGSQSLRILQSSNTGSQRGRVSPDEGIFSNTNIIL